MASKPESFADRRSHAAESYWVLLALVVLLVATFSAYQPSLDGPFQLDDLGSFQPLAIDSLNWDQLRSKILAGRFNGVSRSLGKLSFTLTQYTSGSEPRPFKFQNLLLHLCNGLLVFWLAGLCFQAARQRERLGAASWWPALLVAALWLLHPLQLSTVAYAVQRLVLLSAFFTLLAGICYVRGRFLVAHRPVAGAASMLCGFLLFWPLGLLSKENAVLLSPALVVIELFLLRFRATPGLASRLLWVQIIVLLVLPIVLTLAYFAIAYDALMAGYTGRDFTLSERVLSEVHALWLYLKLILLPIPGHMHLFWDGFPVQRTLDVWTALRGAGLLGVLTLAFLMRERAPLVGFGICWFFVWHMMESTVIPLELVFEHRNYLAIFGPTVVLTAGLTMLYERGEMRRILVAGAAALVALLTVNTISRAYSWSDADRFAVAEYRGNVDSPRATSELFLRALEHKNKPVAAYYLGALEQLIPEQAWPWLSELLLLCKSGQDPSMLLSRIEGLAAKTLVRPADIVRLQQLSRLVYEDKRCPEISAKDLTTITAAFANNPRVHQVHTRIGALHLYARVLGANGDFQAAKLALREAIDLSLHVSPVWLNATVQTAADMASHKPSQNEALRFVKEVLEGFEAELLENNIQIRLSISASDAEHRPES